MKTEFFFPIGVFQLMFFFKTKVVTAHLEHCLDRSSLVCCLSTYSRFLELYQLKNETFSPIMKKNILGKAVPLNSLIKSRNKLTRISLPD